MKLDLGMFEEYFKKGKNFEITEEEYVKSVNKALPQTRYLQTSSPVAKMAHAFNFRLKVEERIHRVLVFTKLEGRK